MKHELLTEDNFVLYCAKHYDKKHFVSDEEFQDDVNRIKYIKKLITRYEQEDELKERLILNHIIVLNNVFGPFHCSRILFLKFKNNFKRIKPFMILMNILPEKMYNIETEFSEYDMDEYDMDQIIVQRLRQL